MGGLKKSWGEAVRVVKKHRLLFLLLIFIQLIFIILVAVIGITYQIRIYENIQGIIGPLEKADYDATALGEGYLFMEGMIEEVAAITNSYKEMISNIFKMLSWMMACFLFFEGLGWSLAHHFYSKRGLLRPWGRFILASLSFLLPVGVLSYIVLKSTMGLDLALFSWTVRIIYLIFLVAAYFMAICFSLLDLPTKTLFKKMYLVGISGLPWFLVGIALVLSAVLFSLFLIYLSIQSLFLMILTVLLLVSVLAGSKLYLISLAKEMIKERIKESENFS